MIRKLPFQDARGQWWIYRTDDPRMHRPLGPFFTPEYAMETERLAQQNAAPMPPSFGPMPAQPFRHNSRVPR